MLGYIKSRPPNILFLGGFAGGVGSNLAWVMTMMTLAMIMMLTAITIIIQMMMTIIGIMIRTVPGSSSYYRLQ